MPQSQSIFDAQDWLSREDKLLAPYAMRTQESRGRRYPEEAHSYRAAYPRDRDRIVHSTAFRRLMYKTQVLVYQTNDHHRTRLTHTLEVAQISRTIARELGLRRGDVENDLRHALRSARAAGHSVEILPARCKSCDFVFGEEKLIKPGRCPACRGTRLFEPMIRVRRSQE